MILVPDQLMCCVPPLQAHYRKGAAYKEMANYDESRSCFKKVS